MTDPRTALHAHAWRCESSCYGDNGRDLAAADHGVQVFVYEHRGGQERRLVLERAPTGTNSTYDGWTGHRWVECEEGEELPLARGSFSLPDIDTARSVWRALGKLLGEVGEA